MQILPPKEVWYVEILAAERHTMGGGALAG